MSKRRSKLEIRLAVLTVINSGENLKTRIMYGSQLSWSVVSKVLNELIGLKMVSTTKGRSLKSHTEYYITEKGLGVLEYFKGAKELTGEI